MTLPPFDPTGSCPKCLHSNITVSYHNESCHDSTCPRSFQGPEHLSRCCTRCHYKWCEAVIPTTPETNP